MHSKQCIVFNTYKFHSTKDIQNLYCNVTSKERFRYKLVPIPQEFHIYKVSKDADINIFEDKLNDNQNIFSRRVYYVVIDNNTKDNKVINMETDSKVN